MIVPTPCVKPYEADHSSVYESHPAPQPQQPVVRTTTQSKPVVLTTLQPNILVVMHTTPRVLPIPRWRKPMQYAIKNHFQVCKMEALQDRTDPQSIPIYRSLADVLQTGRRDHGTEKRQVSSINEHSILQTTLLHQATEFEKRSAMVRTTSHGRRHPNSSGQVHPIYLQSVETHIKNRHRFETLIEWKDKILTAYRTTLARTHQSYLLRNPTSQFSTSLNYNRKAPSTALSTKKTSPTKTITTPNIYGQPVDVRTWRLP